MRLVRKKSANNALNLSRPSGFTLVELMITLAIAAILAVIATPSLTTFIRNGRIASSYESLVNVLNAARTEAISRGASVLVCHSVDPTAAGPSCGGTGSDWNTGLLVYASAGNLSATETYSAGSHVLIKQIAMNSNTNITANAVAATVIGFRSNASLIGDSTPFFSFCIDSDEASGKLVSFNAVGRIISGSPTDCDTPS